MTSSAVNLNDSAITFSFNEESLLEFKENGDIYVKGNLVENDIEVVNGFRAWLQKANPPPNAL